MASLPREFYNGDTVEIAQKLLGKYLVRRLDGEPLVGRITETEAYLGRCDKACHAYGYKRQPAPPPFSWSQATPTFILSTECTTA